MKKIIGVAFCMLLVGSALVQSCSKPDAAPSPAVPVVPVDTTKTVVPLTEQQIIQKAIEKLGIGAFEFKGFDRVFIRRLIPVPGQNNYSVAFINTVESYSQYGTFEIFGIDNPIGERGYIAKGFPTAIQNGRNTFYNKIFVNSAGDSFIGVFCNHPKTVWKFGQMCNVVHQMSNHDDSTFILASDFSNMEKYKTIIMDSTSDLMFPKNVPSIEVQYFYNKDSLVIYRQSSSETSSGDTSTRRTTLNIGYGRKR